MEAERDEKRPDLPERFRQWPGHTGNWQRWPNDRGALNHVTPEVVLRAVATVRTGTVIPCSRPVSVDDPILPNKVFEHEMICAGRVPGWPERDVQNASDKMGGWNHGTANTHIDALAHIGFHGIGFNGLAHSELVTMDSGVKRCDVTSALGIVTRGVFVDAARRRGVPHIPVGDAVRLDEIKGDLEHVVPGDAVIVRLGTTLCMGSKAADDPDAHGRWAGLHAECVDFVGARGASIIATDGPGDCYPSPLTGICDSPVHVLSEVFWGIHLVHNMDLEELGRVCEREARRDFLFMVAAMNVPRATGSMVTPLAVL